MKWWFHFVGNPLGIEFCSWRHSHGQQRRFRRDRRLCTAGADYLGRWGSERKLAISFRTLSKSGKDLSSLCPQPLLRASHPAYDQLSVRWAELNDSINRVQRKRSESLKCFPVEQLLKGTQRITGFLQTTSTSRLSGNNCSPVHGSPSFLDSTSTYWLPTNVHTGLHNSPTSNQKWVPHFVWCLTMLRVSHCLSKLPFSVILKSAMYLLEEEPSTRPVLLLFLHI